MSTAGCPVMNCPACGAETDVEQPACPRCGQTMGKYRQKVRYFSGLAAAYQANSRPEDSLKAWQAVETLKPDYPNLQLRLGEAQLAAGRPDRAIRHFEQAQAETPTRPNSITPWPNFSGSAASTRKLLLLTSK
ncbi:MAG: tetratricopeptide repeat protein [Anaerolineales bacterium]|nr:tetratricopeptide repeat protein [Anaerolineales bacterium]